ncbi:MAG: hypothetical protein M2R45_04767 [Verrucomicrobia subdivision 3 bacterium]|nr:hypothetical protein [Limisphaerales bacterium]MCS1415096.1 hypothetical protein [Limisphaerales bacterium]
MAHGGWVINAIRGRSMRLIPGTSQDRQSLKRRTSSRGKGQVEEGIPLAEAVFDSPQGRGTPWDSGRPIAKEQANVLAARIGWKAFSILATMPS